MQEEQEEKPPLNQQKPKLMEPGFSGFEAASLMVNPLQALNQDPGQPLPNN